MWAKFRGGERRVFGEGDEEEVFYSEFGTGRDVGGVFLLGGFALGRIWGDHGVPFGEVGRADLEARGEEGFGGSVGVAAEVE